jgi:hypothetical protein
MSISLIKLKNGVEIIGSIVKMNEQIFLENPMQINYKQTDSSSSPVISLTKYCPFSSESLFNFDKNFVLHVTPIKKSVEYYYLQALDYYKNVAEKYIDQEFTQAANKDLTEQDFYKAFLKKVKIDGYTQ